MDLADLRHLDLAAIDQETYKTLQRELENRISDPKIRKNILERLERLIDRSRTLYEIDSTAQCLSDVTTPLLFCLTESQKANYFQAQANYLVKQVACSTIDTAQGILLRTLRADKDEVKHLAVALLTADCEPVKTARSKLSDYDKQTLERLAGESR